METKINLKGMSIDLGMVFCFFLAFVFGIVAFANHVGAEDTPPEIVLKAIEGVRENQETIAITRDAHIQFMEAKKDNENRVSFLHDQCYELNFADLTVKKIKDCTPSDFLE